MTTSRWIFSVKLLLLSYLTQWCFLWMKILFCLSRPRSLMCCVLYKCTVRIGCTRSSSLFKEVKQHWARLVRGWMTIPRIFFALIPQYLWPVGIFVSSTCVCPSKLWMELTNFIKKLGHKRLMTSFNRSPYQIQGLCKSWEGLSNNIPVESTHVCTSHNLKRLQTGKTWLPKSVANASKRHKLLPQGLHNSRFTADYFLYQNPAINGALW